MSVLTQNGEGEYLLVAKNRILAIIVLKSHKNERKIKEKRRCRASPFLVLV